LSEGATTSPAPRTVRARTAVLVTVLAVLAYGGLLFYGDAGASAAALRSVRPGPLLVAFVLATANYLVRYLRWEYYLRRIGVRIPAGESLLVFLAGFAMTLTPAKAGEVLKSLLLKQGHGVPLSRSAPVVVAERVTDLAALVLLLAAGSLAFPHGLAITVASAVVVLALMVLCASRAAAALVVRLAGHVRPLGPFVPSLETAFRALQEMSDVRSFVWATALSTIAWALHCGSLYVVAMGLAELHVTWLASCFAYAAPLLAGTLAMLPGGLGLTEVSMAGVIARFGDGPNAAAAAAAVTILVRLITFWWAVLLGFAALSAWRLRHARGAA
jgi:uncharacterized protein (TIRG00374 family)